MTLVLAAFPTVVCCAGESIRDEKREVRQFVQSFYDWYVPESTRTHNFGKLIKNHRASFTPQLAKALIEDNVAQSEGRGELVGLDFEPFTSSQDPCEKYLAGSVRNKANRYRVDIFSICDGKSSDKPELVAEVTSVNDRLVFANFRYENGADLIGILHSLANERNIKK